MKNLITYLKALWSWGANSQSKDVSHDCRLTRGVLCFLGRLARRIYSFGCSQDILGAPQSLHGSPSGMTAKLQVNSFMRFAVVLTLIFTIGVGNAWGTEATLAITSGVTANTTLTDDQGIQWAVTSDGSYTSNNSYIQCGTNKKRVSYIQLVSTGLSAATISKVQVWGSSKANSNVTASVSIGGNSLGSSSAYTTQNASSGGTKYSVENTSSHTGEVTIRISRPSSATGAIYFNKLIVTYTTGGGGGFTPVTGVSVSPTSKSIVPGEIFTITPTVEPAAASNKSVSWTSSVTSTATVNSSGEVTGVAAGTSTITCTTTDGGHTATCTVTVCGVTMQARDEDGNAIGAGGPGAPSRTGASITPAADAGNYVFKEWQITNASLGSSESTKENTITNPTGEVTVTAVYYKPITITYKANGSTFTTQAYAYNGTLAFPANNPDGATYSCTDKTFVGWVGEVNKDYSDASIAPTYATAGGSVTAAATYYAVFAEASNGGGGTKWVLTSLDAVTEGTYAIVNQSNNAFTGTISSGHGDCTSETFTFIDGEASSAPSGTCEITITAVTGGFTMYNSSNGYLYARSASSGNLAWRNTESSYWKYASSNWTYNSNSAYLRSYNATTGGIRTYGANNGNGVIRLAKKTSSTSYSAYSTTCVACANNVTISKGSESNGTFTLSKSGLQATCNGGCAITVTPTPAAHYRVQSVTADNPTTGTATVTGPVNNVWTVTYSENSNGTSTVNVTFEAIPTYTISLDPPAPANGTTYLESAGTTSVTLDEGIICNLWTVPGDCYSLSSITITPADGYSELETNGENQWEILGITKNLSVAVVYAQRAQYTVTLDAGTGSVAGPTSFTQSNCGNITLPAASPSDACATEGWEFAGWSRIKVNTETTSAPVLIPAGSFAPTATETLYAVYKQGSGAAESYWVKAKDDSKLAAGDSVIIAASEYDQAMSTNQKTANRGQASITKSGDTLTAISASVDKFILSAGSVSGTFSFYDPTSTIGYLCAASSSKNSLKTQGSIDANASWEINITSATGVASIVAQGTNTNNVMQYNNSSSLFACYSGASQSALCLYTKAMGSANTYFSSPSCTPCVSAAASLSSSAISMTTGKSSVITLTSDNTSAVTATSSNTEVATVSVSGKNITVNGIAEGEATVIIQQVREGVDASAHCEVYFEVSISVTTATIEIIEWEREAVTIEYDGDPTASVILGKEVEHGSKDAKVATELFFSKYFEAAGTDKLFGIFNGTERTIDLTDYFVWTKGYGTTHSLASYGATPGKIAPQEEIIFYTFGSTKYSKECMDTVPGHEKWNEISWEGMAFAGRHSIGLYKKDKSGNDSIIDIIGATVYNKANPNDYDPDLVLLNKVAEGGIKPSWGDESGFNAEGCGDNISTDDIETNYGLSTNRCLLVRKNTVTSGADAVRLDTTSYNPNTDPDKCAAAFQTLCTEWVGMHVPSWEDKTTATCNGMGYVAGFDYSDYYVTMETFSDDQTIGGYGNGDGTYTIPLPHLDTLACRLIRIQLAKEGNVIASSDPKVPIVVDADMSTNSKEFYKHSIDTCKVCDVVVRDKATLTKATTGAANDRAELQNITVYSGSHLVIPSGATDLRAKSIVLRSLDDTVSTASYTGGMTFKDKGYRVYHSKRVKQDRWYWISLPYTCSTSKITWQDGTKATIGTDFHLKYYDGAQRAATQQGGCWKEYTGSTIQPGVGYILSVEQRVGHTYRELIFPMDTISEGDATKGVPVDDYGAGESITPNHKGWNLVGNPYMTYYQKNKINAGDKNLPALTVGKLVPHDSIDAANPLRTIHTYTIDVSGNNNAPFITVPKNQGNSEYEQKLIMDYDLPPFISYFVQIGNNTPVATQQYVNFAKEDLTITPNNLLPASYICRRAVVEEEVDPLESVLVTLRMKNHDQEADETTFIISDQYSADYEIGSDLGKWFGDNYKDYTKPVLYSKANDGNKLVFYSLPDASAEQWIPLGFWGGNVTQPLTFSLRRNNRKLDYVKSVMLHDKTQNTYTELLENDYQFAPGSQTKLNGSRFEVKVLLERPKNVPTGLENIHEGLYAYANGSQLVVVGLPEQASVWIYDAVGHLIASEATVNYMRTYTMPAQGVYFVRVNSAAGQQTLRTIVK